MTKTAVEEKNTVEAFSFGDPVPVLGDRGITDFLEVYLYDDYYEPPVSLEGLSKAFRSSPYHSSAIIWKINKLTSTFIPNKLFKLSEFKRYAFDWLVFGNGYAEMVKNRLGEPMRIRMSPGKSTRRMKKEDNFLFLKSWNNKHYFKTGSVYHIKEPDLNQEIYGVPQYLSGLQAALLDESATLFRRKYYLNGSHAGYILYLNDTASTNDVEGIKKALKESKGPGNFKNLFLHAPSGKKDGLQVLPLAEATAKDEFLNIKRASRMDLSAAHRVPSQLLGVAPENVGGYGDANTADQITYMNEIVPLQNQLLEMNDYFEMEIVSFKDYEPVINNK